MNRSLTDAITALLPDELGRELRQNIDAAVTSQFERMELVTREQLDIQEKVLQRTRRRLEELEQQVETLEKRLAESSPD